MADPRSSALNESQQRRLIVTCQHVDRLLGEVEDALDEAESRSPFRRYAGDLSPDEQELVRAFVSRLRGEIVRLLERQGLSPSPRRVGLRHALLTHVMFIDVAVEELKPRYMRGYGAVAPEAAGALDDIAGRLKGILRDLTLSLAPASR